MWLSIQLDIQPDVWLVTWLYIWPHTIWISGMQYLAGITMVNITTIETIYFIISVTTIKTTNIIISVADAESQLSRIDPSKNEHPDLSYQMGQ